MPVWMSLLNQPLREYWLRDRYCPTQCRAKTARSGLSYIQVIARVLLVLIRDLLLLGNEVW
jgi:hypothetical protein